MENIINFDIQQFIATIGYVGIFAIVFAESGLLIGRQPVIYGRRDCREQGIAGYTGR